MTTQAKSIVISKVLNNKTKSIQPKEFRLALDSFLGVNMKYDVIVIGAGPSGLTAALNCLRGEKKVLIIEKESIGGQISFSPRVENFPTHRTISGSELADKLYDQVMSWGADFEFDTVTKVDQIDGGFKVTTEFDTYHATTIIIATGVKHRPIGVAREEELVGRGISYCALCDGAFFENEDVVVIGDANTALQYALVLANTSKSVHICTLFDRFFADKPLQQAVLNHSKISVTNNLSLLEFLGEDEIEGLLFENTITKEKAKFDCKGVFICIGQMPHNEIFAELVDLDKAGFIISDESCTTKTTGIFVAGDTRTKSVRQLATAVGDGSIAGTKCCDYLNTLGQKD